MNENLSIIKEKFNNTPSPEIISSEELFNIFNKFKPIIVDFLNNIDNNKFHQGENFSAIEKKFMRNIPDQPVSWDTIISTFNQEIVPRLNSIANKHFFAFVPGDPAPPAMIGAIITPILNQFIGSMIGSPGGVVIEGLALHWIKQMMGYPDSAGACFTSGGSVANLTGLYSGLINKAPWIKNEGLFGNKKPLVYCSDQTHNSITKSLLVLGIGLNNIRIIETNDDFTINTEALRKIIKKDKNDKQNLPAIIIGNAGTTNTGAIDDLKALYDISKENDCWLHIDAAYGGFARISKTPASELLVDINLADSIALDGHKWLFVPFEAGMALVKKREDMKHAFSEDADYLMDTQSVNENQLMVNFWEYSFPMSREFRGLKVWMLINAYGKEGLSNLITKNILLTKYLSSLVEEHPKLELMSSSELSIVCFRWKDSDEFIDKIIEKIQKNQKYYLSRTKLKGKSTIRVCIVNLESNTTVIDGLIKEIESIVSKMEI